MKKVIFILLIFFVNSSCMSKPYEYKYISLENMPDIKILSHGKSELGGLKFDEEMPISYELDRGHYVLLLEVDKISYWPSILVSSKSPDDSALIIEPIYSGECGGFDQVNSNYKIDNLQARRYEWSPAFRKNCDVSDNEENPIQQIISFQVKNQKGNALGAENIPFSLVKNGIYYEKDGI